MPLSALILSLIAVPLSFVNPRAGRSMNLALALMVYMIYSNLLSVVQASIARSQVSLALGIWGVHLSMFVLLLLLFYRRLMVFSIFRLFK